MKTSTTLSLLTAVIVLINAAPISAQSTGKRDGLPVLKPLDAGFLTLENPSPTTKHSVVPPRKVKIKDPIGTPTKHYLSIEAGAGRIDGSKVQDSEFRYDFKEDDGQSGFMLNARYGFGAFGADAIEGFVLGGGVGVRYIYFGRNGSNEQIRNSGYVQKQRIHYLGLLDFCFQMGYRRFILDIACGAGLMFVNERIVVDGEMMNFGRRGSGLDVSIAAEWKITNGFALGVSYTLLSGEGQDKRAPYDISRATIEASSFMAGVRFYLGNW